MFPLELRDALSNNCSFELELERFAQLLWHGQAWTAWTPEAAWT